jgi:hypothetical protein
VKCENDDCNNEVNKEHIEHLCAGYVGGLECDMYCRFCSCCPSCRQLCIDGSIEEEEQEEDEGE